MGKGDKRTKKGKIVAKSYGNCRKHKLPAKPARQKLTLKAVSAVAAAEVAAEKTEEQTTEAPVVAPVEEAVVAEAAQKVKAETQPVEESK